MDYLRQVQKGVDYIEAHLHDTIALADVSRVAGVSHWHFQRMFKALTNETLKTYVRSRRLAEARVQLVTTRDDVLTIALRAGFESQASFTRAFKRAFGVPPAQFRTGTDEHLFLEKARIDEDYIRHLDRGVSAEPEFRQYVARHFVGLRTQFFSVDSERNNIADKLPALWDAFLPHLPGISEGLGPNVIAGTCYGIVRQSAPDSALLEYTACIEVREPASGGHLQTLNESLVHVVVPAATYAVFTHLGEPSKLDQTVSYIYGSWLMRNSGRHNYGPDLEVYGPGYVPGSVDSTMDYAIPLAAAPGAG